MSSSLVSSVLFTTWPLLIQTAFKGEMGLLFVLPKLTHKIEIIFLNFLIIKLMRAPLLNFGNRKMEEK